VEALTARSGREGRPEDRLSRTGKTGSANHEIEVGAAEDRYWCSHVTLSGDRRLAGHNRHRIVVDRQEAVFSVDGDLLTGSGRHPHLALGEDREQRLVPGEDTDRAVDGVG